MESGTLTLKQFVIQLQKLYKLGLMRKLEFSLNKDSLNQIYLFYIRSLLEYSSVVWAGRTEYQSISIKRLQHEAARIVNKVCFNINFV